MQIRNLEEELDEKIKQRDEDDAHSLLLYLREHCNFKDEENKKHFIQLIYSYSLKYGIIAEHFLADMDSQSINYKNLPSFLLEHLEKDKLQIFVNKIDERITYLDTLPKIAIPAYKKNFVAAVAVFLIQLMIYFSLEMYLIIMAFKTQDKNKVGFIISAILFGGIGIGLLICVPVITWVKARFQDTLTEITKDEWKDIQAGLDELINQSNGLKEMNELSLPYQQGISRLETHATTLNSSNKRTLSEAKDELTKFKNDVVNLKELVMISKMPFAFLPRPRQVKAEENPSLVIDLSSESSGEEIRLVKF
jgi:hypothetical protein